MENYMQILIGVVVALEFLHSGSCLTFPSIIFADAESNSTNIFGKPLILTSNEVDMIGSMSGIGAILGAIVISSISSVWGRKPAMFLNGLIGFCSWIAIALSPTTMGILITRTCSGISVGGISVVGMNYLSETADDKVRGILCSLNSGFLAIGSLLTILLGYWFRYYYVSLINSLLALGFMFGVLILPESPKFLAISGNVEGAREALSRIRKADQVQINKEIASYIEMNAVQKSQKDVWKELTKLKMLKRILVISVLFTIRSFGGNEVLTINATRIFNMLSRSGNEELFSIILFLIVIPGYIGSSSFLIDRIGRKKCMYLSISIGLFGTILLSISTFLTHRSTFQSLNKTRHFEINNTNTRNLAIINLTGQNNQSFPIENSTSQNIFSNLAFDTNIHYQTLNSTVIDTEQQMNSSALFNSVYYEYNASLEMFNNSSREDNFDLQFTKDSAEGEYNNWILVIVSHISVFIANFGFSLGVEAVPFVVNAEYFPTWLRAQTSSIGVVSFLLSQSIALQSFTPLVNLLGISGYILCSAFVLLLSIPFIKFCLEETMGKNVG